MESVKSKPLSSVIFIPLLLLIFIRPFFSALTYPALEIYYERILMFLAVLTFTLEVKYRFKIFPKTFNNFPVLALFLAYAISNIYSINPENSVREIIKFVTFFAVFFMVSQTDNKQKNLLVKTIVVAGAIIGLYSIYQYFWGYQRTIDYLKEINSDFLTTSSYARDILLAKRAIGTFPSPNILGSFLLIAFFLSLSLKSRGSASAFGKPRKPRPSLGFIVPLVLIASALILTKSMGAWLSIIFGLAIFFLISCKSLKQHKRAMAFCVILIGLALTFILITRWERLMNLENPQNSITQRINYWRTGIAVIKDHCVLGVGPGNFQEVFLSYKVGLGTNTKYAHNILLHYWAETGILGLAALVYLLFNFFRKIKKRPECKFIYLAALAFIAHNFIDITYFIPETGLFFWVLLGLCASGNLGAE